MMNYSQQQRLNNLPLFGEHASHDLSALVPFGRIYYDQDVSFI